MDYAQRRKLQGKETERRILNAALDLMRDRGFDKVSIRDICKEAGITTGAFYHHFSSKEALLESGFAPLDDYMAGALAGHEEEPPDLRLWRILSAYAKFMEQSGELIGRYYQRRIAEPGTRSMDATRYTLRAMLDCFRQAEGEGLLRPEHPPEWVADFCFRHFRGVVIDWALHQYSYPLLPKMQEDYKLFAALFHT
ncbi:MULTISPECIES: TetR/AcrR family transcriptional regulator [Intestinimonas]|uniref:TetR/AcrR family transcriptional regulator n=1 Tax=Intestinimonas TaxID=1392389 RepID=UPI00242FC662|nr:TetR/AcrR family transcriptional regulator [Intestinimonas butyriciproducens]MCI6363914.1 TetR/AcrR family transcriptional regulator [Intestinimonas butyriciproducens]MDY3616515.1 TetR/AcrR family transcriptional regulator [Intestinimonas butyriciproducens]